MNKEAERLLNVERRDGIPYTKFAFGRNPSMKPYIAWACYTVVCVVFTVWALAHGVGAAAAFGFLGVLGGVRNLMSAGRAIDGGFDFAVSSRGVEVRHNSECLRIVVPYNSIKRFEVERIGCRESCVEYLGMRLEQEWANKLNASLGVGARPIRTYLTDSAVFVALVPTSSVDKEDELVAALEHIRTLSK